MSWPGRRTTKSPTSGSCRRSSNAWRTTAEQPLDQLTWPDLKGNWRRYKLRARFPQLRQEAFMAVRLALGTLLVLSTLVSASAQQITTGTIQGTVTDVTGSVLPGATVEARNTGTNFVRSVVTDANG